VLARRQGHFVLLDEGCHVLVANNGALPLLDAEYVIGNDDLGILLDLRLAGKTILLLDLLAAEETNLGRQDVTSALFDDTLALAALTAATACA
jgi:hypothetical protein